MKWYCRWCGAVTERQRSERDGFCIGGKCKQAHFRAYKKYKANVTLKAGRRKHRGCKSNAKGARKRGMIKTNLPSTAKRKIRRGGALPLKPKVKRSE